jgi:hypothetical protein
MRGVKGIKRTEDRSEEEIGKRMMGKKGKRNRRRV